MVFGFSLFCSLLNLSLLLAEPIFESKPAWVTSKENFVTFGLKSHDGRMIPTTIKNIESFRKADGIDDVAFLGSQQTLLFSDDKSHDITIAYFSPNFPSLLEVNNLPDFSNKRHSSVWITDRFWRENYNASDVEGATIYISEARVPAIIEGVLSPDWNQIGISHPDIITSSEDMPYYLNITLGDHDVSSELLEQARTQLSKQIPAFYGIARLVTEYSHRDLKAASDSNSFESHMRFWDGTENLPAFIISGVDLSPEARNVLKRQWWMVLWLAIIFGCVNALNLLTICFHELIKRSNEFSIRIAMGARLSHLIRQLCSEQIVFIVAVITFGSLLSYLLTRYSVYNHGELLSQQAVFYSQNFIFSLLVVVTLVLFFACAPLFFAYKDNNFSRTKDGSESRTQSFLARLNLTLQVFLAGSALSMCVVMLSFHWANLMESKQYSDTYEQIVGINNHNSLSKVNTSDWFKEVGTNGSKLAISAQSFLQPSSTAISFRADQPDNPNHAVLNIMNVNNHFIDFFSRENLLGRGVDNQGVVLNYSAAKMLGYDDPSSAIGARLFADDPFLLGFESGDSIRINGIVENLPHFGSINKGIAVVYADLELLPPLYQFHVYSKETHIRIAKDSVERFIEAKNDWVVKVEEFLVVQFDIQNKTINFLIYFCLALGVVTALLSLSGFYYQFRSYVIQQEMKLAIHLALGAKFFDIVIIFSKTFIPIILLSSFSIFIFAKIALSWFENQYPVIISGGLVVVSSLLSVIVLVFFTVLRASWSLSNSNINDKLRSVD